MPPCGRKFIRMKHRTNSVLVAVFLAAAQLNAQPGVFATRPQDSLGTKMLTMEDSELGYGLRPERMQIVWRPGTACMTVCEDDGIHETNRLDGYDSLLLSSSDMEAIAGAGQKAGNAGDSGQKVPACSFVKWLDGSRLLLRVRDEFCIVDVTNKKLTGRFSLPDGAQDIVFNPSGYHVFTKDNGLYFCDNWGNAYPIAESGDRNIIYGQYVSRNEFGITGGIFLSGSGRKVAFYRKDESAVGTFPLLDITTRTGTLSELKYPMAGMASENVRIGVYDFAANTTVYLACDDFGYDQYLTGVTWSPDERYILVQVLDRSQKHMRLNMYDAGTGAFAGTVLSEDNDKFVEPQDPVWFLEGSTTGFIYRTDNRDGYKNLYLCSIDGDVERLTCTDADVAYVGNDGRYVYYTSAEVSPVENHLFSVDIRTGKTRRHTSAAGWHEISMSPGCVYFADTYSSLDVPGVVDLCSTSGKGRANLLVADNPVKDFQFCEISLGTVRSADGKYDNYYRLIKPKDFDPTRKYPVILYVYGGPHSQLVRNTWLGELRRWEMYMAQHGYIVYIQDNRGTLNRGADFEKAIYGQCGQAEMADQMEGIRMLSGLDYVDKDRIGVHGWSYGGFMTISLITNYPDIFKVAVAGGPVIDWKWYEVMYGERYMGNPAANPEGYALTSLISKAADLKGKLLICQGAVDNVVLWQHSLNFIRECIRNNVQVAYFPYPCAQHNVLGKDRIHLMDKVTMYFEDYL